MSSLPNNSAHIFGLTALVGLDEVVASARETPRYQPAAGRIDRLSLAWWRDGPDDPTPIVLRFDGRLTTLVVSWPTDPGGYVEPKHLDEARVLAWRMDRPTAEAVLAAHQRFPLGRHDLRVRGYGEVGDDDFLVTPCRDSVFRRIEASAEAKPQALTERLVLEIAEAAAALQEAASQIVPR